MVPNASTGKGSSGPFGFSLLGAVVVQKIREEQDSPRESEEKWSEKTYYGWAGAYSASLYVSYDFGMGFVLASNGAAKMKKVAGENLLSIMNDIRNVCTTSTTTTRTEQENKMCAKIQRIDRSRIGRVGVSTVAGLQDTLRLKQQAKDSAAPFLRQVVPDTGSAGVVEVSIAVGVL